MMSSQGDLPIICGFTDSNLFKYFLRKEELAEYNEDMTKCPQMKIEIDKWDKKKVEFYNAYHDDDSYENSREGRVRYCRTFDHSQWAKLTQRSKSMHSAINCLACVRKYDDYALKLANKKFITLCTVEQDLQVEKCNRQSNTLSAKRRAIKEYKRDVKGKSLQADFSAVFGGTLSLQGWQALRMRQYGEYKTNKQRRHTGAHEGLYAYDKHVILQELEEKADANRDLGDSMRGKWAALARKSNLRSLVGANTSNQAQIVQDVATEHGYTFKVVSRMKRSWRKHPDLKVSVNVPTSYKKLVEERDRQIASGEIDIGRVICPITTQVQRRGKVIENVVCGRALSLLKIRARHLHLMTEKGLLRVTDTNKLKEAECKNILKNYNVLYEDKDAIEELRAQVEELETTRHFVCWHDHSDIFRSSYYLVMIWFLYDPAVYLTDAEVGGGMNVQSEVEEPYLHIIAKSKSSTHDQLQYVEERIKELQSTSNSIRCNGRVYKDKLRFFSGDLPARNFEAGQMGAGSRYPCICGTAAADFPDVEKVLQPGPFQSLTDRVSHIGDKSASQALNLSAMKKDELQKEMARRGLRKKLKSTQSRQTLERILCEEIKGIQRLPALLTTGLGLQEIGCTYYEIMMCEPLHDLTNVIRSLLLELPHHILHKALQIKIKAFCDGVLEEKTMMKGCDARLYLIHLAIELQQQEYQRDSQCQDVYRMVYSLCEIQRLAYQLDSKRCSRDLLRFHTSVLQFVALTSEVFGDLKSVTKRSFFGTSYHSIVNHMPETYRYVSLRSIVTEASERMFHHLRKLSASTNRKPDNMLRNAVFRLAVHMKNRAKDQRSAGFLRNQKRNEKSEISLSANHLIQSWQAGRTILTQEFMNRNKELTVAALRRVAGFIREGPGVWYSTNKDGDLILHDGPDDPQEQTSSSHLYHFRDTSAKEIREELEEDWKECLSNTKHLKISILVELHIGNADQKSVTKAVPVGCCATAPKESKQTVSTTTTTCGEESFGKSRELSVRLARIDAQDHKMDVTDGETCIESRALESGDLLTPGSDFTKSDDIKTIRGRSVLMDVYEFKEEIDA